MHSRQGGWPCASARQITSSRLPFRNAHNGGSRAPIMRPMLRLVTPSRPRPCRLNGSGCRPWASTFREPCGYCGAMAGQAGHHGRVSTPLDDAGLTEAGSKWALPLGEGKVTQLRVDFAFASCWRPGSRSGSRRRSATALPVMGAGTSHLTPAAWRHFSAFTRPR